MYTFGDGSNGQLGHGNLVLSSNDPIAISWPNKTTRIVTVCCGEGHTAFISGLSNSFFELFHVKLDATKLKIAVHCNLID